MSRSYFDNIAGLASIFSVVFTIVIAVATFFNDTYQNIFGLTAILSLIIVNLTLSYVLLKHINKGSWRELKFLRNKLQKKGLISKLEVIEREKRALGVSFHLKLKEISKCIHNVNDEYRNKNIEIFDELISSGLDKQKLEYLHSTQAKISSSIQMFHLYFINNVRDLFNALTEDSCAVTIKLFSEEDVWTYMRDSRSYRERSTLDSINGEGYKYHENTAFNKIMDPSSNISTYSCDNLTDNSEYVNKNSSWKNSYNATLVVPIRMRLQESESEAENRDIKYDYDCVGFLCVDNMKGNLDNTVAIDLLSAFADILYNQMSLIQELMSKINMEIEIRNYDKSAEMVSEFKNNSPYN